MWISNALFGTLRTCFEAVGGSPSRKLQRFCRWREWTEDFRLGSAGRVERMCGVAKDEEFVRSSAQKQLGEFSLERCFALIGACEQREAVGSESEFHRRYRIRYR